VVLVLLGLISVLAAVAARSVSSAAAGIGAARLAWQAEADVRAGIELGVAAIRKLGPAMRSADASANLAQRRISVRVTNERARIDLNRTSAAVLARLFESKSVLEDEAAALAASVIEWRGGSASQKLTAPSDDDRPFAAFTGFSASPQPGSELKEGPKQIVGTRFFFHPWQLASVPGFSKALVAAVLPLVTVASGSPQVDPYIAPDGVLASLPGTSAATIDAFRGARDSGTSRATTLQLLGAARETVTADAARGWRIEIAVRHQDGRVRRSEAVIAVLDGDTEPYRVLYVLDDQQ
jgi:hypothetical protein